MHERINRHLNQRQQLFGLRDLIRNRQGQHPQPAGTDRVPVGVRLTEPPSPVRPGVFQAGEKGPLPHDTKEICPLIHRERVEEPVIGDGKGGAILTIAQIEDGIRCSIPGPHRNPRPIRPLTHLAHVGHRSLTEAGMTGLVPTYQQRHNAPLYLARTAEQSVVSPTSIGQWRKRGKVFSIRSNLLSCGLKR